MFVVLWLNGLFIFKLIIVYKECRKNLKTHSKLLHTVTRTAILCFASSISAGVFIIIYLIRGSIVSIGGDSAHLYLLNHMTFVADLWTNFLSILLSFDYFNVWYMRLCGCCDKRCHLCWDFCAKGKGESNDRKLENIESEQTH